MDFAELYGFMQREVALDRQRLEEAGWSLTPEQWQVFLAGRRQLIFDGQFSDTARYIYHDPVLSPGARHEGSKDDETSAYGHLLVQLVAVAASRGIDLERGVEMAVQALRDKDWAKREGSDGPIRGMVAATGRESPSQMPGTPMTSGFIARTLKEVEAFEKARKRCVLVLPHPRPSDTPLMLHRNVNGVVTDEGGMTCHAATICREHGIPCIVGTGNATTRLRGKELAILSWSGVVTALPEKEN